MTTPTTYDRFHVVLVEPGESLNVGSVARAMNNLGFRHLHLVAPRGYDAARARVTACWSESLLDALTIHDSLDEAVAGAQEVVGLAMRGGVPPPHFVTLPTWAEALPAREPRTTALVFGPEDDGLRNEHLERCRWVIRIPSMPACWSFNLAQAVLLVLYEITRQIPNGEMVTATASAAAIALPTDNEFRQVERLLDSVMAESGFVRPGTVARVPGVVKNLFRRTDMTAQEMGILLAFVGRLNTALRRRRADEEQNDV